LERTTDHCHSVEPHRGIIRGVAGQTDSTLRGKLTLAVPGKDTISNVWIANTGKYSLACVSAIATELKLNLLFDNKGVYLLTTSNKVDYKKGRMIGQLRCGLYHVFDDFLISQTTTSEPVKDFYHFTAKNRCKQYAFGDAAPAHYSGNPPLKYSFSVNSYTPVDPEVLVHNRLGHPCQRYMLEMIKKKTLRGIDNLEAHRVTELIGLGTACCCIGCIAKQNRQPTSKRTRGRNRPTDKTKDGKYEKLEASRTVATDTFGPFYENYYGIKYAQVFVHIESRKAWLFGMKRKSDFPVILKEFLTTYRTTYPDKDPPEICRSKHVATFATNTDFTIRLVRTDRAPEFATAEARAIYNEFGIRHLRTVAHSSWENGFAERVIQTINKIASAQLVHAKFTPEEYQTLYWQSLRHGVDVYNLCPHSGLDYLCPNEIWTGTKPHINELRTFGSTAYEYLEAKLRPDGKRSRRFRLGVYLGKERTIDPRNPAMRIYIPHRNQIFLRKSVILDETLSHTEARWKRLREGAHYVNFEEAPNRKCIIPTLPPFFEGVDVDYDQNWSKIGDNRLYKPASTTVAPVEDEEHQEINDEREAARRLHAERFERPHTRSQGPVVEVLMALDLNSSKSKSAKMKVVDVDHDVATIYVDYMWACQATQGKDFKITMKQFDNPTTAEAMLRDDWPLWLSAIKAEFDQLKKRGTWVEVDGRLVSKRPLGTKMVLKVKRDPRTSAIIKRKARLTVQGFRQIQGYDYTKTTSPVTVYATFLFMIAHALKHGRKLKTMDFAGAFLFPYLKEEIYMKIPQFYEADKKFDSNVMLLLKKSLYGLKQASREWYLALSEALQKIGFEQAKIELDQCLFYHRELDVYLCVHVDDCFLSYMDEASVEEIVRRLTEMNFEFSIVEKLNKGLGLSIKRDDEEIVVSQPTYVDFIEQEFENDLVKTNRTIYTPMVDWLEESKPSEELMDTTKYRSLLGCLSHLGRMTRPDILQATFHLAQFSEKPCHRHWKGLSRIVHYLSATKNKGIRFSKEGKEAFRFYVDADWGGDPSTRRSTTGYLVKYMGGPIIAVSRRQRNVTLSSTEAEYCAFTDAAKDIIWTKRLAEFFNEEFPKPAILMNDNITAQNLAQGEATLNRMKHIDALSKHMGIRYHWIRELIDAKLIELKHVSSAENEGDLFTKPLGKVTQNALRNKVMNMENTSTNTIHAGNAICGKHHSFEATIDMEIVNSMVALGA